MIKRIVNKNCSNQKKIKAILGGIISGISLGYGIGLIMPIGIGLLWSISSYPFLCFAWGLLFILFSHSWLLYLHPLSWIGLNDFISLISVVFIWFFCASLGGLFISIWSIIGNFKLFKELRERNLFSKFVYALFFSIIWGLFEALIVKTPFFWIGIGSSTFPDIFVTGLSKVFGVGGLASIQMLTGWFFYQLFNYRKEKFYIYSLSTFSILFFLLIHITGFNLLNSPISTSSLKVTAWQTNIPLNEKFSEDLNKKMTNKIQKLLSKAKETGSDLFITPEGTLPPHFELLENSPIDLLSGGFRYVDNKLRSSVLLFKEGQTDYLSAIDKSRLVPLGESVPDFIKFFGRGLSLLGGIDKGDSSRFFQFQNNKIAIAICYEISDGNSISQAISQGANWILTVANLDPYPKMLQNQFIRIAQIRSIENNKNLLSVSNTGKTFLISSSGEVLQSLQPFKEETANFKVDLNEELTIYSKFREKPLILVSILLLLFIFIYEIKLSKLT